MQELANLNGEGGEYVDGETASCILQGVWEIPCWHPTEAIAFTLEHFFQAAQGEGLSGTEKQDWERWDFQDHVFLPQEGIGGVFPAVNSTIPSQHLGHSSREEEKKRYCQTPKEPWVPAEN